MSLSRAIALALLAGILKLIDDKVSYRKPAILSICIVNVIVFVMTGYILYHNSKDNVVDISGLAIFGVILSYVMWWIANFKNSSFNVTSSLGGDTNKPLTNG